MICRVALHENPPGSITSDEAMSFRAWLKEQPGFVGGYHAQDSQTGTMVSITVWDSQESMEALKDSTPPGGPLGIVTEREELFDVVEEYQYTAPGLFTQRRGSMEFSEVAPACSSEAATVGADSYLRRDSDRDP